MLSSFHPPTGTVQRWCRDYVRTEVLEHKFSPPPPPRCAEGNLCWEAEAPARRLAFPGRPPQLRVLAKARRSPGPEALRLSRRRAQQLHTFLHHELQAAELLCWAILAFPSTPESFRRGLLQICLEEIRHMNLYRDQLRRLGVNFGEEGVRDWFWLRVPQVPDPASFVAVLGIGFEGGNLDHAARFAELFDAAGDAEAARIQREIARDEVGHVRFAVRWFKAYTGGLDFDRWWSCLPGKLSPLLLRGRPMQRAQRLEAGIDTDFLDRLEQW
jgi:uncharacterized ferritin-like protein (DUF455 family)